MLCLRALGGRRGVWPLVNSLAVGKVAPVKMPLTLMAPERYMSIMKQLHSVLKSRNVVYTQTASLFQMDLSKLPKHDPAKGDLAYVGQISNLVRNVKTFSLSTSIMGLAMQPYILIHAGELPLWLKALLTGSLSFFVFVTPLLIHFFTSRYVVHLYHHPDSGVFTATTFSLFVREKKIQFLAKDVEFPEIHGILSTVNVKGRPLFMDPTQFIDREVYIKMMRYDQPIDWQADLKENDSFSVPDENVKKIVSEAESKKS